MSEAEPDVEVEDLTPHNKALHEAGKSMLVESIDVGREFCKFMTTNSLAAIPTYLALLKLVLPKDYSLQGRDEVTFLVPPALFLIATGIFVLGYFPTRGKLSLDMPHEIERERSSTIARRSCFAKLGFAVLALGVGWAAWVLVNRLGAS